MSLAPSTSGWFSLLKEQWPVWRLPLFLGAALASLGVVLTLLPQAWGLQESADLLWLYSVRGDKPPPNEVVVVVIDRGASESLSLPRDPALYHRCIDLRTGPPPPSHITLPPPRQLQRWPRCVYAQAVQVLAQAGARVIALDIQFSPRVAPGPGESLLLFDEQDHTLAEVMGRAGNVVVANALETRRVGELVAHPAVAGETEDPAPLSPVIDESVMGTAPFLVVKDVFGQTLRHTAFHGGEYPTVSLPVLAVQLYALDGYDDFMRLLRLLNREYGELLPATRAELIAQRQLQAPALGIRAVFRAERNFPARYWEALRTAGSSIPAHRRKAVETLYRLYSTEATPYFDHYGPAGAIKTIGFEKLFAHTPAGDSGLAELRDKVVVVGADYGEYQSDENHRTPLTGEGLGVNGAELAGVAIANLISGSVLHPIGTGWRVLIALSFGFAIPLLMLRLPFLRGAAVVAAIVAAYALLAQGLFGTYSLWMPIAVPLLVQAPGGIVAGAVYHYFEQRNQRKQVRDLFKKFLPDRVIDTLLTRNLQTTQETGFGVCMFTDAENYTTIAESMHPDELERFVNRYYSAIFPLLEQHAASTLDLKGDSVLAVWSGSPDDSNGRRNACLAALETLQAVDRFNAESPGARLPTLIGLNCGELSQGLIGTGWRYEYRPVGDTVNASERLQRLNKSLGTRILASEAVIHGLDGLLVRDVGVFLLRGKTVPTHVFEVMDTRESAGGGTLQLCLEFALALDALRSGFREGALARLRAIRERYPLDGPTAFYIRWLSGHHEWEGGAIPQE